MLKLTVLRVLVCLVILALLLAMYVAYHLFEIEYYLFGASDAGALVDVWLDQNGDGNINEGEPPLEGVCVWAGYSLAPSNDYLYHAFSNWEAICERQGHRTDENGKWYDFFPGGACSEIRILAKVPEGYQPTTSLAVSGCSARFGFVEGDPSSGTQHLSAEEYLRKQIVFARARRVVLMLVAVAFSAIASAMLVRSRPDKQSS